MGRNWHQTWPRVSRKIENLDLLIDMADIKTLSRRMYETGKISSKVRKKWRARTHKLTHIPDCDHLWIPSSIVSRRKRLWVSLPWTCCWCRCSASAINLSECPTSFQIQPYLKHVHVLD